MELLHEMNFGNGYVQVQPPVNEDGIEVDIVWNGQSPSATIQSTAFIFLGETAKGIYAEVEKRKLNSGKSIYEGIPYRVTACDLSLSFDLVLIISHPDALFSCDEVSVPIVQRGRVDWLMTATQGFSFWYLATEIAAGIPGAIRRSDFKFTPYAISEIPNYSQIITLQLSVFTLLFQTIEQVNKILNLITDVTTDAVGLDLPRTASKEVGNLLKIIAYTAYLVFLILSLINLIKQVIENTYQRKKYKLCMREKDLFQKMCDYLGLNFSSTIYASGAEFENATWMPRKIVMPSTAKATVYSAVTFDRPFDENTSNKSYGYFDGTAYEFIQQMTQKYNAECVVLNGTLHFEEKHSWDKAKPYQIPNTDEVGNTFNLPEPHGTNSNELTLNYLLQFSIDETEYNTFHKYRGTSANVQITPAIVGDKKNMNTPAGVVIQLDCALAKRKEYLTLPEVIVKGIVELLNGFIFAVTLPVRMLIEAINLVVSLFGGSSQAIPQLPSQTFTLNDRIGWMLLSNDSFSVPKTFIGTDINGDWEIAESSERVMSAENLMAKFHGKNLPTRGNQYLTYKNRQIPFCCKDLAQVIESNVLITPTNDYGKFDQILWNPKEEIAKTINFRVKKQFDGSLRETIIIDGNDNNVTGIASSQLDEQQNG